MLNLPMRTKVRQTLTSGVMTSTSGRGRSSTPTTHAAAAILIFLAVFPSSVMSTCADHFIVTVGATLQGLGDNLILSVDVNEEAEVNTELYTLNWDEDINYTGPVDPDFIQYFAVNKSVPAALTTSVYTSLIGVPDYPINQDLIQGIVSFDQFTTGEKCSIQMSHTIIDENTKNPTLDQDTYVVNLREDYPTDLTIYTLTVNVHDDDGTSPNKNFALAVTGCPLEATEDQYGGTSGTPQPVQFRLTSNLDFETQKSYMCTVTATDEGVPPRSSTPSTINLTVVDEPDEPPKFRYDYYYAQVDSSLSSDTPLMTEPGQILAPDGDTVINSDITYSMRDARLDVPGSEYFTINKDTAEVTLTKDLDDTILIYVSVTFFITATDTSSASSSVMLKVDLPPLPTTTVSTTDVTCPECTCPSMTTAGTCNPCPTTTDLCECPTTGPPSVCTTEAATCEPCATTVVTTDCPICTTLSTWLSTMQTCSPCPSTTTTPDQTTTPCPTEATTTPCPQCPTDAITTPCPTEATTTTCPLCPTDAITTPCPTEATTTPCPLCPTDAIATSCPTEATTTTCPLCPTDEISTSNQNTCPTITCPPYATTTQGTNHPSLFQQESYIGEILPQSYTVFQVSVYEEWVNITVFTWESGENEYFAIDPTTGWITTKKDYTPPGAYYLVAVASVSESTVTDRAQVTIKVLSSQAPNATMTNSLVMKEVQEGDAQEEVVVVINTEGYTDAMCIIQDNPPGAKEKFNLVLEKDTWKLKKIAALDFEKTPQIELKIEAFDAETNCNETSNTTEDLLRSQTQVIITVGDVNDVQPQFVVPEPTGVTIIAYPQDKALQNVVGPVITLQATDVDTVGNLTYGLVNSSSGGAFTVESDTGAVYVEKEFLCSPECILTVSASDGVTQDPVVSIKVLRLDIDNIFTIVLKNKDVSQVEPFLQDVSHKAGVQVSKLYVSPIMAGVTSARGGVQRLYQMSQAPGSSSKALTSSLQVHVYSLDTGTHIMSLDELNKALSGKTEVVAQEFTDKNVFQDGGDGTPTDTTGLKVAVGILGALVGLILISAVVFFIYKKKTKDREAKVRSRPINTLGGAYPNLVYNEEHDRGAGESLRSSSHKTNGTMNSATNGLGTFGRRDSPPLFMSALAVTKSESPKNQQQRGLRRVDPGTPEYYGSSSPAPPPAFNTAPTVAVEAFTSFSDPVFSTASSSSSPFSTSSQPHTSSMYPSLPKAEESPPPKTPSHIYANINILDKKDPPPIRTTPTKSILKSYIESSQDPSTTVPSAIMAVEKPAEPDADYDETDVPLVASFSALKGSPPPRKHSSAPGGDEDDDSDSDQGKTITYPGGKKSNLKHETDDGSDDEKKSVAFKVLVDTKEIEAENLGPSQKAAVVSDALELMEANKKKLEAEGSEDSEDESEEDEKL